MRTVQVEYADVRFLVLALVGRVRRIARADIFKHILYTLGAHMTLYIFNDIKSAMISDALVDLVEDGLLIELGSGARRVPMYALTEKGWTELVHEEIHFGARVAALHAIRNFFSASLAVVGNDKP